VRCTWKNTSKIAPARCECQAVRKNVFWRTAQKSIDGSVQKARIAAERQVYPSCGNLAYTESTVVKNSQETVRG
jgi:hypothetical protein